MWVIQARYSAGGELLAVKDLIDTGLYSNYSQEFFGSYGVSKSKSKNAPVPVYVHKGIPFATCGWTYYDTVRMLVLYGDRYRKAMNNPDAVRHRRWLFLRYLKYMAKFAVLYTQINRIEGARFEPLKATYEHVKRTLGRSAGILKGEREREGLARRSDLTKREIRVMADLLGVLEGKTNMRQLEAVIAKGGPVINMRHTPS